MVYPYKLQKTWMTSMNIYTSCHDELGKKASSPIKVLSLSCVDNKTIILIYYVVSLLPTNLAGDLNGLSGNP